MIKGLLYINGELIGEELEKIEVTNPATGELVGTVPNAGAKETRQAIEAAQAAFGPWSGLTAYERAAYLMKWHDLILTNKREIAEVLTQEMGKPLAEAEGEIMYSASFISWFAEEGKRIYGRSVPASVQNKRIQVWKQPVGVVAGISPWNFPAAMITRKIAPALAAGCTFVGKPAELTPLTAIRLAELAEEAGIPKGVINIVTGNPQEIGQEMTSNPIIRKLTFTGSTGVGKLLMRQGAENMLNLSLELGGHAPMIILEDADLDKAVAGVMVSKFRNAGQTCICGNRIYVHKSIEQDFLEKFKAEVEKLKVGNGLEPGVTIGPLINQSGYEKVEHHVNEAKEKGAAVLTGGNGWNVNESAYFFEPTILTGVTDDMVIMTEETFGPIAPVQTFENDQEVIKLANNSKFGLSAYVFTESLSRGVKVIEGLDYGIVGWNEGAPSVAQAPFGGMKESGLGREGGIEGLEAFLETKYVSIGL
ncbi:NAD-dependent succinate-semialdehyde dehydrogenase [Jeotgalibacillus malaysiensis]|uniref:NAD-dependent succinate-semialdehyde dehydrogenase n=1 Tax=Jeotgalibacillus malaysiensis TaxID=1508404 RepID=UPI003850C42E